MLSEFEEKIARFLKTVCLSFAGQNVLLAISGGADSIALMFALDALRREGVLDAEFTVAHINHGLRGQLADADEQFVKDSAKKLGIAVVTRSVNVRSFAAEQKLSIETAARNLRTNALVDIAGENLCRTIVTAHHKDDNAETVIHRLMRGTGFRGLAGIWPRKTFTFTRKGHDGAEEFVFIRPLLCVTRAEVIEYCKSRNLCFRHDHTNDDLSYTRNHIRHVLLPYLQSQSRRAIAEELAVLSQNARKLQNRLRKETETAWEKILIDCGPEKVIFQAKGFSEQPELIRSALARRALVTLGSGERDLTAIHYGKIVRFQVGQSPQRIDLPAGFSVTCQYEKIIFSRGRSEGQNSGPEEPVTLNIPGRTTFAGYEIIAAILEAGVHDLENFKVEKNAHTEWFDFDKLSFPLIARTRATGDRFCPLGTAAATGKKVGKFLTTAKVARYLRSKVLIIADKEKIVWVGPVRAGELTKITPRTKKIVQLTLTRTA